MAHPRGRGEVLRGGGGYVGDVAEGLDPFGGRKRLVGEGPPGEGTAKRDGGEFRRSYGPRRRAVPERAPRKEEPRGEGERRPEEASHGAREEEAPPMLAGCLLEFALKGRGAKGWGSDREKERDRAR